MARSPWDNQGEDKNPFNKFKRPKLDMNNFQMPNMEPLSPKFFAIILAVILGIWLASGFYKVNEGEEGAVTRFGKYVRKSYPGLNYHLPKPIENVYIEKVNKSRRIEIGYRSNKYSKDSATYITHESTMLTGDENIVDLTSDVMWHIKDLEQYLFNVAYPEEAVKTAAESAIREVVGETPILAILSNQKEQIATKIETLLQTTLDQYKAGIQIEMVQLLRAEPPAEVIDAYRDVQTSRADKEREINQAMAYNNDVLPKARGEAAKVTQEAEAYKQEVISKAEGDAKRFEYILSQYNANKRVMRDRLYLDTLQEVLNGKTKYIVGPDMLPHMAINKNMVK